MWIIQEVLLARKILVLFDNHFIYFSELMNWTSEWDLTGTAKRNFRRLRLDPTTEPAYYIISKRSQWQLDKEGASKFASQLDFLIEDYKSQHATDPRDMVFALLGLLEEREASMIGADYSMTAREVYERVLLVVADSIALIEDDYSMPKFKKRLCQSLRIEYLEEEVGTEAGNSTLDTP